MAQLRWGSATHEGRLRAQNEDHAYAGDGLFVVADGMGGHLAGEVASEMAVTRLRTPPARAGSRPPPPTDQVADSDWGCPGGSLLGDARR